MGIREQLINIDEAKSDIIPTFIKTVYDDPKAYFGPKLKERYREFKQSMAAGGKAIEAANNAASNKSGKIKITYGKRGKKSGEKSGEKSFKDMLKSTPPDMNKIYRKKLADEKATANANKAFNKFAIQNSLPKTPKPPFEVMDKTPKPSGDGPTKAAAAALPKTPPKPAPKPAPKPETKSWFDRSLDSSKDLLNKGYDKTSSYVQRGINYAKDKPWNVASGTAAAAALGLGAYALRKRLRKKKKKKK